MHRIAVPNSFLVRFLPRDEICYLKPSRFVEYISSSKLNLDPPQVSSGRNVEKMTYEIFF